MFWSLVVKGLRALMDYRIWIVIVLALSARAVLMAAAGLTLHHSTRLKGRIGTIIDHAVESALDGAFMFVTVLLLFPALHSWNNISFLARVRQSIAPAFVVGVTDALAVGAIFLLISVVPCLKRVTHTFPAIRLFLEGVLLFEFCIVEFNKFVAHKYTPATVIATIAGQKQMYAVIYPVGFLAIGLLAEWMLLYALSHIDHVSVRLGVPEAVRTHLARFTHVARGLIAGLLPLLMYAGMAEA